MSDPLAASVSVLCHFDGAYGTTTYTNEVPDGPALASTSGLARLVTASEGIAPLFGSACLLSPEPTSPPIGNGVWISSIPASGLGTAWCVEIAFYEESIDEPADPLVIPPGVSLFTTYGGESSNLSLDYYDSGTGPLLRLFYWDGATYQTLASSSSLTAETWHQVCADYDGTTIRLFADGVLVDSASLSSADFDDNNGWLVQGSIMGGDRFLIDELRITHASRRTANYTPETLGGMLLMAMVAPPLQPVLRRLEGRRRILRWRLSPPLRQRDRPRQLLRPVRHCPSLRRRSARASPTARPPLLSRRPALAPG